MIFFLTAMLLLSATSTSAARPCVCGKILAPVCGSDQRTYNNKCLLKCAQTNNPALTMVKSGACHDDEPRPKYCICPLVYDPVCFDGNIYPNQCTVTCRHKYPPIKNALIGECRKKRESVQVSEHPRVDCICPYKYAPVCGSDGQTYENNCMFECARAKNGNLRVDDHNNCKKGLPLSCVCPKIYKPLCGSDGETYGNPCLFKCAKKTNQALIMIHKGRC